MKAHELRVGDVLRLPDREVIVTSLVPKDGEEALRIGARSVFSGTWWHTYDADDEVPAVRPSREGGR